MRRNNQTNSNNKKDEHLLEEPSICKNCGAECNTAYCGKCGQSMSVSRLETKSFLFDMVSGLLRINRGFLFTAKHLLFHPWKVIREYIKGKRVNYTSPVNMLVILCFLGTLVGGLFFSEPQNTTNVLNVTNNSVGYRIGASIGGFFKNNSIAHNLTIYFPALLAIPIVYRNRGGQKYNLAEYVVAMIYIIDALLVFGLISVPLRLALPDVVYKIIDLSYSVGIAVIGLFKAFPMEAETTRWRYIVYYMLTVGGMYFSIAIGLGLIASI